MKRLLTFICLLSSLWGSTQSFPNPATLSTGQGAIGTLDPIWLVSPWYTTSPPNPIGLTYSPALINNNCAPGAWVNPAALPPPVNNGNWITGNNANCGSNTVDGYRYFRLTLNLPPDCNGNSVAVSGNYVLYLTGYVDNQITNVFVNGTPLGLSGGSFSNGAQLNMAIPGPWVTGINFVDIQIYNIPNGGGNPYGLLLVANSSALANLDTDGDGVSDINDACPCQPATTANGCPPPITPNATICQGDTASINVGASGSFSWNSGQTSSSISVSPATTTTYTCTVTYANGTQDVLSSTVSVNPSYNSTTNASICAGESYTFGNTIYTQAGTYPIVNQTITGCDSIATLVLTVNPTYNDTLYQSICLGETLSFEGNNFSTSGIYDFLHTTILGCDSVHVLNLTVLPTTSSTQSVVECGGYSWNGQAYTQSGTYSFLTTNSVGCDSTAQLNLIIHTEYTIPIDTAICPGEIYSSNGLNFNQTGTYTIPLQTINGCDSMLQINLLVYPTTPIPQLSANQPECPGDLLELTANGIGAATVYWTGPANFQSTQPAVSIVATSNSVGTYSAYCIENGCTSGIATVTSSIAYPNDFDDREFPNVLTPNNDFINDYLDLKEIFQSCMKYELRILNRWGNLVYYQTNESTPFNGKNQDGMNLEEAVYFYSLQYEGNNKTGFFHLIR
jgi:gliding motility-associated-like protein